MTRTPQRFQLTPDLSISRILTGLWQVADMEKDGKPLDLDAAAEALGAYADAGFDTFDMADHYGSAELVTGRLLSRAEPGQQTAACLHEVVPGARADDRRRRAGRRRGSPDRLGVDKVDLLQFHWWTFEDPAWLDALHEFKAQQDEGRIGAIGLTNFDAAHLAVPSRTGSLWLPTRCRFR